MNGNLNAALILLDRALEEIENGFVRCGTCGDQETTNDLDFVDDLKRAKSELLLVLGKKIGDEQIVTESGALEQMYQVFKERMIAEMLEESNSAFMVLDHCKSEVSDGEG